MYGHQGSFATGSSVPSKAAPHPVGEGAAIPAATRFTHSLRKPMPTIEEQATHATGTVEWFDAVQGVGLISSDDGAPPCTVRSDTLRACGIDALAAGDRVRFRVRDDDGERAATDLTLLPAVERWENEGGAVRPTDPEA